MTRIQDQTQACPVAPSLSPSDGRPGAPRPLGPTAPAAGRTGPHSDSGQARGAWLLITGSRTWKTRLHRDVMDAALTQALAEAQRYGRERLTILHGAASGADSMAARWAVAHPGVFEIPHPADWAGPCGEHCKPGHRKLRANGRSDYCPQAGCYRNQTMVNTLLRLDEPRLVLAFFASETADSAGTADCLRRAKAAGLPWRAYDPRGPR